MKKQQFPKTRFRLPKQVRCDINAFLVDLREASSVGLHLGAGNNRIEGLINCDLFNPYADRKVDARDLKDLQDNSVDLIEHHHMIEHLSFADFECALTEWHRVLREDGYLVFTCPDIRAVSLMYLKYTLFKGISKRNEKIDYVVKMFVGSQEHEGMFHKNHFDAERVRRLLPRYGFEVNLTYTPFPKRSTPSLFVMARKRTHRNKA